MYLVPPIPQLLQNPLRLPIPPKRLLHSRRSTQEHHAIIRPNKLSKKLFLHTALPYHRSLSRLANSIQSLKPPRVLFLEGIQLLFQENVFFPIGAVHERDLCLVFWVAQNGTGELVDGRDAASTRDQRDVGYGVRFPLMAL